MGKNILVVAATTREIRPFIEKTRQHSSGLPADIFIAGIGLTATAYHLTKQLALKKYDCIIQAGVAGCYDPTIPLGTVFAIKKDTIADQSVVEMKKLKTLFDLKLVPHNRHPYYKGWLTNPHTGLLKSTGLKTVNSTSVNEISTSEQMINFYRQMFKPVTESMEGAAFHYVCLMENIPFIQLRSVSNYIGERNKKNWNMSDSVTSLNQVLIEVINNLYH